MMYVRKRLKQLCAAVLCICLLLPAGAVNGAELNPNEMEGREAAGEAQPGQAAARSLQAGWIQSGGQWWYREQDGSYPSSSWKLIGNIWYYFDQSGWMVTGLQTINGSYYYFDSNGHMITGWQWIGGKCYYFQPSGAMAKDTWVGEYYVDSSGAWAQGKQKEDKTAGWVQESGRWKYRMGSGSYVKSAWEKIGGSWYYFDGSGWMLTGWQKISGSWYYMVSSGRMATGWQQIGGTWYYLDGSGRMLTGWQWIGGKCYYLNSSGAMAKDTWVGEYYVDSSGAWAQGKQKEDKTAGWVQESGRWKYRMGSGSFVKSAWEKIGGSWYYFDGSGWMLTGWQKISGSWYYMVSSGRMATGWQQIGGTWYYLDGSGRMLTGWQWIGGKCYYLNSSGAMAKETWVGESYVDSSGAWVQGKTQEARWIKSGNRWWYQEKNGSYPKNSWKLIQNSWYYFDGSGWMLTGWQKINGSWYYLEDSGRMLTGWQKLGNIWYYLNPSGQMLTGWQKITGDWYYLNGSGHMLTGWQQIGGTWYYMNSSGHMLTGWQQIGGLWYYLKDAGQMATGWLDLNGARYYLDAGGQMLTGWQTIDGYKYHFYSNGAMAKSTSVDGISINGNGQAMVTPTGKKTIRGFLENALAPVGQTMYIYGGGHDGSKGGDAVRVGVNPQWKTFYGQQDSSYDFTKYRYKHGYGLDCSGLVGWAVYNTFNTQANKADYSSTSTLMPQMLADRGLGSCSTVSASFQAGDVVSKPGHTWIILGTCSDGSAVLIHSTPPVVQISGTVTPQGIYDSEAVRLAQTYMKRYYQDAASRFRLSSCDKSYLTNVSRMRWSDSTLSDPDGFRGMQAPEILKVIFGE